MVRKVNFIKNDSIITKRLRDYSFSDGQTDWIGNLPLLFLDHFSTHNISTYHRHADMPKHYKSTARNVHRNVGK